MEKLFQWGPIYLVAAKAENIEQIRQMESHWDSCRFVKTGSYDEHLAQLDYPPYLTFMIKEVESDETIGYTLNRVEVENDSFELRRVVITKKGHGYGRAAVEAMFGYAFTMTDCNKLWLDVYPDNHRGIKLYESLAMHRDGILRENSKWPSEYRDQIVYSLLRSEFERRYKCLKV